MVEMYELDYGYRVKVISGKHAGKEGVVVMGSRFGHVGVNLNKKPVIGTYHIGENPSNLEIISTEDEFHIKDSTRGFGMSQFDAVRILARVAMLNKRTQK